MIDIKCTRASCAHCARMINKATPDHPGKLVQPPSVSATAA
jgi:hypothetical protein